MAWWGVGLIVVAAVMTVFAWSWCAMGGMSDDRVLPPDDGPDCGG